MIAVSSAAAQGPHSPTAAQSPTTHVNYGGAQPAPPPPAADLQAAPPPIMGEYMDGTRFRFGFTIHAGGVIPTRGQTSSGGFGGFSFRAGAQIDNQWAVYYMGTLDGGGYSLGDGDVEESAVYVAYYNTVLASFTLGHMLEFAAGPSIDSVAAISGTIDNGAGTTLEGIAGTSFGLHGRIALLLGSRPVERARRIGFTLSLDVHPTFVDDTVLMTVGVGAGMDFF